MRKIFISLNIVLVLYSCTGKPVYPDVPFDGSKVVIDTNGLKDEVPVFYSFRNDRKIINFFVLKIDNEVQSYFDACAKCYPKKMGYRVDRKDVVCRACDIRYSLRSLKEGIGSCYPIVLKGKLEGDKYLIDKEAILEGSKYF
ncbi:MAG: Fe-S-containing protein [Nitrospirota bacterium]